MEGRIGQRFAAVAERMERSATHGDPRHKEVSGKLAGIERSIGSMETRMASFESTMSDLSLDVKFVSERVRRQDERLRVVESRG